jgi:hypothetical protein
MRALFRLSTTLAGIVFLCAACSGRSTPERSADTAPNGHDVTCTEPLPQFTLGPKSHATKAQAAALCACIWAHLTGPEQHTSEQIAHHKMDAIAEADMEAFPAQFAAGIQGCGAAKL